MSEKTFTLDGVQALALTYTYHHPTYHVTVEGEKILVEL
jgi:hypothetical protein